MILLTVTRLDRLSRKLVFVEKIEFIIDIFVSEVSRDSFISYRIFFYFFHGYTFNGHIAPIVITTYVYLREMSLRLVK